MQRPVVVSDRGLEPYEDALNAMRSAISGVRTSGVGQLWWVQHPPVFTQGQAGRPEHLLATGDIPVVQSDRGGQVTYHGPGQQILYTLLPIALWQISIRRLVDALEASVIATLATRGIIATSRREAPGVYVGDAKIASLGLRVRHGVTYHGVALNVAMDLSPFARINPCGYQGLQVTEVRALQADWDSIDLRSTWLSSVCDALQLTLRKG